MDGGKSLTLICARVIISLVGLLLTVVDSRGDVRLPALFSDNRVMQQEMLVPVWEWTDPGEKITTETTTGAEGNWNLSIGPLRTEDRPEISSCATREGDTTRAATVPNQITYKDEMTRAIVDELQRMELYSLRKDIINGTKWTFRKMYRGSPYLSEGYWPMAELVYRGTRYTGLYMNYDLYHGRLILLHDENGSRKYLALSDQFLDSFSYTDTVSRQQRRFVYMQIPGTDRKALYEKVYQGKTSFLIRPRCEIRHVASGGFPGEYIRNYEYYIVVEGRYERVHSKKTLLNALKRDIPEVKRFIRKNRLKINKNHPENMFTILRFYDSIT